MKNFIKVSLGVIGLFTKKNFIKVSLGVIGKIIGTSILGKSFSLGFGEKTLFKNI